MTNCGNLSDQMADLLAMMRRTTDQYAVLLQHMADTCAACQGAGRVYKAVMKDGPDGTTIPAEKDCPACAAIRQLLAEKP